MVCVLPRAQTVPDMSVIHAANAVYALMELRVRRGDLAAAGVLWGRVVRVGAVVTVGSAHGSARVMEIGVLVGRGTGPHVFRNLKVWDQGIEVFAPVLQRDQYGMFVGEWRSAVGRDDRLRHWLDLWGVYGAADDPKRLGRPVGAVPDGVLPDE